MLTAGCTDEMVIVNERPDGGNGVSDDPTGTPVLFSAGNLKSSITRADVIPYMEQGGRFVCSMYYHSKTNDTDSTDYDIKDSILTTAWLQVNDSLGNSVFRKNTFVLDSANLDNNKFDVTATNFYWQNRLKHAFLALADYNKLKTNDGDTATVKVGKLKMYPHHDKDMFTLPENATHEDSVTYADKMANNRYVNTFDLTRGTKTSMSDQPDPILALTIMKPAGATQEANRVRLYFKHQFSQIQVNLRGAKDNSTEITAEQIDSVELLGVSKEAYVYSRLNADGTVGTITKDSTTYKTAVYQAVNLDSYTDAQIAVNKWGTSFNMFDMYKEGAENNGYPTGFLKSYNAIAYGYLWAIRISWHEGEKTADDKYIEHVSTYARGSEVCRKQIVKEA